MLGTELGQLHPSGDVNADLTQSHARGDLGKLQSLTMARNPPVNSMVLRNDARAMSMNGEPGGLKSPC